MAINKWKLTATVAIPVIGGSIIGKTATQSAGEKYKQLKQPSFAPPGWVFPVAWTSLYAAMGVAKYAFDRQAKSATEQKHGNQSYNTQLGLNFLVSIQV